MNFKLSLCSLQPGFWYTLLYRFFLGNLGTVKQPTIPSTQKSLKFRNTHSISSWSLKKYCEILGTITTDGISARGKLVFCSASSFRTQNFNVWRAEHFFQCSWKISDGEAGFLQSLVCPTRSLENSCFGWDETAVKVSTEKIKRM